MILGPPRDRFDWSSGFGSELDLLFDEVLKQRLRYRVVYIASEGRVRASRATSTRCDWLPVASHTVAFQTVAFHTVASHTVASQTVASRKDG